MWIGIRYPVKKLEPDLIFPYKYSAIHMKNDERERLYEETSAYTTTV